MLTEPEYDRLPGILRRIVDADRALVAVRRTIAASVLSIDVARGARRELTHRRALSAEAERLYGHRLAGAGPASA
ncbi:hypothetical protein [Methylobacterium sp. WL120]|uniref:hypothetical protein n=1 Tax=Methylobacterium sp. WL120 TaxID=2603887 RepID=UPI0011C99B5C|nr:hypothetical protein [Methylobacterium sp. WL120]TXM65741.1 hypothetical protein FV229_14690 [Methylobacterium sp. WL120]